MHPKRVELSSGFGRTRYLSEDRAPRSYTCQIFYVFCGLDLFLLGLLSSCYRALTGPGIFRNFVSGKLLAHECHSSAVRIGPLGQRTPTSIKFSNSSVLHKKHLPSPVVFTANGYSPSSSKTGTGLTWTVADGHLVRASFLCWSC